MTRLRSLILAAGCALQVHTILRARRIVAQALELDGDPEAGCCERWYSCRLVFDDLCGDSPDGCDDGLAIVCGLNVGHVEAHYDAENDCRWARRFGLGAA